MTQAQAWKNEALRFWYLVVRRNRGITLRPDNGRSVLVDEGGDPIDYSQFMTDFRDTDASNDN